VTALFLFLPLPNHLTILSAVAILGGLYLFFRGFGLLARKRLLLSTPTSKIRSASIGLVEVTGAATGPFVIPAPITGNPCYLYKVTIWKQREESKNRDWQQVAEENMHVPFFLDDTTGKLLVDPSGAELDLQRDFCQKFDQTWFSRVPDRAATFLARHGITPGGDHFRIEEWTISPRSTLFIVGTLAENQRAGLLPVAAPSIGGLVPPTPAPAKNAPDPEVIRLSAEVTPISSDAMTQQQKIAAALTKAGIHKPEAWAAAGLSSPSATAPTQLSQIDVKPETAPEDHSEFNLSAPVILRKGENNPAFLISWRSQRELVNSLTWKSAAMIWLGGGLTLLGLYVLLMQMELL